MECTLLFLPFITSLGLVNWLGAGKVVEILKATRDRGIWKDMTANAIKHGTR